MKKEFTSNPIIDRIFDITSKSYGLPNLKHLNISATILMCECEYGIFENLINLRNQELEQFMANAENEGMKVAF